MATIIHLIKCLKGSIILYPKVVKEEINKKLDIYSISNDLSYSTMCLVIRTICLGNWLNLFIL